MKTNTIQCGDWHLGWGYGGHDKIGRLTINEDGTFTWRGKSQGRRYQFWNYGAYLHFKLTHDNKMEVIDVKGSYPVWSELLSSANELLRIQSMPEKVKRIPKPKHYNNPDQTSLP